MTDIKEKEGASSTLSDHLLFLDPQDELNQYILGLGEGFGNEAITVVYDKDLLLEHWMKSFSRDEDDLEDDDAYVIAVEWFDYNVIGAYLGPHTPVYMSRSDLTLFLDGHDPEAEESEERLVFLEPRSELDTFMVGLGLGFGGTVSYMYDKDRLLEFWLKSFIDADPSLDRDEAFNMALDVFEQTSKMNEGAEHPPSFVSMDEFEVFKNKYLKSEH